MIVPPDLRQFDTNILLHCVRDDALARHVENIYSFIQQGTNPLISVVTEGEIRALALRLRWGPAKLKRLDSILARAIVVPLDFPGVIAAYAQIDAFCRGIGTPIGENDTWSAATAHATGARLLTTDRDFDNVTPTFVIRD